MDHLSIVPDMHSIPELTPTANFFWSQILPTRSLKDQSLVNHDITNQKASTLWRK